MSYFWGTEDDDTLVGGTDNDSLFGYGGADVLIGYTGDPADGSFDDDTLDGGEGADVMMGGRGYDTYWADDVGDVIVEILRPEDADDATAAYHSYDKVYWTGEGTYVLPIEVDILHVQGGATAAAGNDLSNVLFSDYGTYTRLGDYLGDGAVTLDGAGGDDFVFGGNGDDVLFGGEGADTLNGLSAADEIHGGGGDDTVLGDDFEDAGGDTLFGDAGDDRLDGGLDNDALDGGDGSDLLLGAWGDDMLTGGAGVDRFADDRGTATVTDFTDGEDLILGDSTLATIVADGVDTLVSFYFPEGGDPTGVMRLVGVDAATITAEDFVTYREGSVGDDTVTGTAGDDYVSGGDGEDDVDGGAGDDGGDGGAGNDDVAGGGGNDDVSGGTGNDTVSGGSGNDEVDGGSGNDTVNGGGGNDDVDGGDGDDVISGGSGNDDLDGGAGDDVLIVTDEGETAVDTGGGVDMVEASVSTALGRGVENLVLGDSASAAARHIFGHMHSDLRAAAAIVSLDGAGNRLANLITGSSGANRLAGAGGDDTLVGRGGSDTLFGGSGSDRLDGGGGIDQLTGGSGADTFVVADRRGIDRVADFNAAEGDTIEIRSAQATSFGDLHIERGLHGSAVVSWTGGAVTLAGVKASALDASDFRFSLASGPVFATEDSERPEVMHGFGPNTDLIQGLMTSI